MSRRARTRRDRRAPVQPGEYPPLVCDYCGALTPDPWHSSGMLHGKMSKHIHSCDACAAQGAAQAAPVDAAKLPSPANVGTAPKRLNLNDQTMWVLGWNECLDAARAQEQQP